MCRGVRGYVLSGAPSAGPILTITTMSQFFRLHPDNPQPRLIKQAAQIINDGGVVALPTDSSYALACHLDDKTAVERLRRIRGLDEKSIAVVAGARPVGARELRDGR